MRVYRAEAIEGQIELLRTKQEALDTDIAKKRAGIAGLKAEADSLLTTADMMEDEVLGVELLTTTNSLKKQVILDEAAIRGMLAQIEFLGEEIAHLNALFVTVQAREEQDNAGS